MKIPTPGADAVLDEIDRATRDMDVMCFCGCGELVTKDSPSMYFAYQACSELWHQYAHLPEAEAAAGRQEAHEARRAHQDSIAARVEHGRIVAGRRNAMHRLQQMLRSQPLRVTLELERHNAEVLESLMPEVPPDLLGVSGAYVDEAFQNATALGRLQNWATQAVADWMNRD